MQIVTVTVVTRQPWHVQPVSVFQENKPTFFSTDSFA